MQEEMKTENKPEAIRTENYIGPDQQGFITGKAYQIVGEERGDSIFEFSYNVLNESGDIRKVSATYFTPETKPLVNWCAVDEKMPDIRKEVQEKATKGELCREWAWESVQDQMTPKTKMLAGVDPLNDEFAQLQERLDAMSKLTAEMAKEVGRMAKAIEKHKKEEIERLRKS